MLRHLAYGWRNFVKDPDRETQRLNWEFFAVIKGSCAPQFVGQPGPPLKRSTLWLLPPQGIYVWQSWNRPCLRAMFQIPDVPELMVKNLKDRPYLEVGITEAQGRRILQLAEEIQPFYFHPDDTYELRMTHLISELSLMIAAGAMVSDEKPLHLQALQRVHVAETFYRENLHRRPILREVAARVGVSESQLRRHFQKVRYHPPEDIFRSIRLQEACRLLLNTTLTNDLIAAHTGFGSTIDFHRTFKARYGVTPHYWRTNTKILNAKPNFSAGKLPSLTEL